MQPHPPKSPPTKTTEALRDRFFTLAAQATGAEAHAYRDEVNALDGDATTRVGGLRVCFHPTARFKAVRFFDASLLDGSVREWFARPLPHLPHLAAGFVDPEELSFRSFENIISLDGWFDASPLALVDGKRLGEQQVYAFTLDAPEATKQRLLKLDELGLYVAPLNAGSRGGQRFIFHSAALAESLTRAVKAGLDAALLAGFSHVNPVFRCNRFEPGDEKFHQHFDTPYFDASRKHVSRQTLLVYLTGGTGSPTLDVEGAPVLERVAPFTCVVMDQRYSHEGRPYDDGRKVFLRTELVFEAPNLEADPRIAEAFAKAVYLTGQSVFAPELERFAEASYNRVASAHWKGLVAPVVADPLLHKDFRGLHFVTNGFDFWFPQPNVDVKEATALALLDFFNAELDGVAFRKACKTKALPEGASPTALLAKHAHAPGEPVIAALDKDLLFPPAEQPDSTCCPFHGQGFQPTRHSEVVGIYEGAQDEARARVGSAPVLLMGDQVMLDPTRFVLDGDKVHVLSQSSLAPVNFAACWNFGGSPEHYVGVETTVTALQPLVPPVLFGVEGGCWHLRFDLFRNGWMVKPRAVHARIPAVLDRDASEVDDSGGEGWLDDERDPGFPDVPQPRANAWWGNDSALLRELDGYRRG